MTRQSREREPTAEEIARRQDRAGIRRLRKTGEIV